MQLAFPSQLSVTSLAPESVHSVPPAHEQLRVSSLHEQDPVHSSTVTPAVPSSSSPQPGAPSSNSSNSGPNSGLRAKAIERAPPLEGSPTFFGKATHSRRPRPLYRSEAPGSRFVG
jgi:hypothetical protein